MQLDAARTAHAASLAELSADAPLQISPEELLGFLEVRLEEMDTGISAEIKAVETQGKESSVISQRRELLDQIANEIRLRTDKPKEYIPLDTIQVQWQGESVTALQAVRSAGILDEISHKTIDRKKKDPKRFAVSLESIEGDSSRLEKEQKRLTSNNDLRMLRLQDMMNRRSQLVQMVSNFLRSLQDSQRTIVGNIR